MLVSRSGGTPACWSSAAIVGPPPNECAAALRIRIAPPTSPRTARNRAIVPPASRNATSERGASAPEPPGVPARSGAQPLGDRRADGFRALAAADVGGRVVVLHGPGHG